MSITIQINIINNFVCLYNKCNLFNLLFTTKEHITKVYIDTCNNKVYIHKFAETYIRTFQKLN